MTIDPNSPRIRLGLPKGRMQDGVLRLLAEGGINISVNGRAYRPAVSLPRFEAKMLKPQGIVEMLQQGSRDLGFTGADWVAEREADVVELLDTGLDRVRIVAAAPEELVHDGQLPAQPLRVTSEYESLTRTWIAKRNMDASFVRSWGATEVLPPEDADCIVDNTATGSTLEANGLVIVDELMTSSTRLYASPVALADPNRKSLIDDFVLLLQSVIEARQRVMLELNVSQERLDDVVSGLPAMRVPTVSPLHACGGFAVKAAVRRTELPALIPDLKARGGTDITITNLNQIVP